MRSKKDDSPSGIFDPFSMFFPEDDFSDEESNRRGFGKRRPSKIEPVEEDGSILDYFIQDDEFLGTDEQREPSRGSSRRQKNLKSNGHSWRGNAPKKDKDRRLVYGRKNVSKRNSAVENETNSWTSDRRDMPSGDFPSRNSFNNIKTSYSNDGDNNNLFPPSAFPSFMEALAIPWEPWGDQESTDDSSGASYTDDEESLATASDASLSFGTHEPQEVQQILVQFNPLAESSPIGQETSVITRFNSTSRVQPFSTTGIGTNEFVGLPPPPRQSSRQNVFQSDDSTLDTYERFDNELDVEDAVPQPSRFNMQKIRCCSGKNNGNKNTFLCGNGAYAHDEQGFPIVRMIADEKGGGLQHSSVVAKIKDFKGNVPAHLQVSPDAFLATQGPQSLYEYEYDDAEHMDVAYSHFGPNPLSLLMIRHHPAPPVDSEKGSVVQVEASTISMTDCSMRSGEWLGRDTSPLPITPGVDIVGKVYQIDKDLSSLYHINEGDRVIALTRHGGNSRYISIDPTQLVKISGNVDPAEAACLAETYLSAFQVLHFGQSIGTRYRSQALKGKSILVLGAVATTLGHAVVELALVAGVEKIYATSTPKHFPHLRSLGIIPVSVDPALWYDQLNGEIDLLFVSDINEEVVPEHFKVLSETGHLVVVGQYGSGVGMGNWESGQQTRAKQLVCNRDKAKISMIDRTHDYNPFRQWTSDLQKSKKDLAHLIKLLEKSMIKPNVLDRIPLNKVAKAQEMVESKRHPSGFLVCEPWLRNKKRAVRL